MDKELPLEDANSEVPYPAEEPYPVEDPELADELPEPVDRPPHEKLLPSFAFSSARHSFLYLITLSEVTLPSSVPANPQKA